MKFTQHPLYAWIVTVDQEPHCLIDILSGYWRKARCKALQRTIDRQVQMLRLEPSDALRDELKRNLCRLGELENG